MSTLYVVSERHFRYNDEQYIPTEGGNARLAFKTKAEADAKAREMTLQWLRENNDPEMGTAIPDWSLPYDPSVSWEKRHEMTKAALVEIVGEDNVDVWNYTDDLLVTIPDNLTTEQEDKLLALLSEHSAPYLVEEVELVGA